ncbi:BrnT family toxin [Acuticoccus sp.]
MTIDDRQDYGEVRQNAVGFLDGRLINLTFTMRGPTRRIISMRRAREG